MKRLARHRTQMDSFWSPGPLVCGLGLLLMSCLSACGSESGSDEQPATPDRLSVTLTHEMDGETFLIDEIGSVEVVEAGLVEIDAREIFPYGLTFRIRGGDMLSADTPYEAKSITLQREHPVGVNAWRGRQFGDNNFVWHGLGHGDVVVTFTEIDWAPGGHVAGTFSDGELRVGDDLDEILQLSGEFYINLPQSSRL